MKYFNRNDTLLFLNAYKCILNVYMFGRCILVLMSSVVIVHKYYGDYICKIKGTPDFSARFTKVTQRFSKEEVKQICLERNCLNGFLSQHGGTLVPPVPVKGI